MTDLRLDRVSVSFHERLLRQMKCAASRMYPVTLHHTHGGTMKNAGWHVGMAQRQNPFLQIPLHAIYHVGKHGIDAGVGVLQWENTFGGQIGMLAWVNGQLTYDLFEMAQIWEHENRSKTL